MHLFNKFLLFTVSFSIVCTVNAQTPDSTASEMRSTSTDSVPRKIDWNRPPVKKAFPVKSFFVPAVMIAYGITSIGSDGLKQINRGVKEEVYDEHPHPYTKIDNYLVLAPVAAVYGLNAMGIHGKHNFRDRTLLLGMSSMITGAVTYGVKSFSGVERPDKSDRSSFPSGHTAAAFAAAEFMRQEYKDVSPWYGVAGYAMAATTGYLRMYNNKHWLSDVVAGAGVGIASTKLAYWLYPILTKNVFKSKNPNTVVMPMYQNGAVGLGLVHRFK